ncbi:hypothetical protein QWJ90_00570 [Microbacterium oryzae]|uniref:hypothetical protein n=1 Tax=Microbacterium oryzae TaxID=743009 RepID=UPI0025AFE324|nr:hypothetical protein [Microbacterium oryzae]MDN3309422.1 hypothetical protein [Microbacterium oryzae]
MLLVLICAALLVVAVVLTAVWWREPFIDPPLAPVGSRADGLRVYARWALMLTIVGITSGVLVVGAGGRLVMRLLAVASPEASGRITEAQATVGEITVEGTLGYLLFGALPAALVSTALYLLVAHWIPRGALAGPVLAGVCLVIVGTTVDPLRAENIDFAILDPDWLGLVLFALLAVLQGAFVAAVAARLSRSLPPMSKRNLPATAVPFLLAVAYVPLGILLALGAVIAVLFPRALPTVGAARASGDGVVLGRALLVLAVVIFLPQFVVSVVAILDGP